MDIIISVLQLGRSYDGTILDSLQWEWLNNTLINSNAEIHIIISSIQILTTNPVIESWGHFPMEKNKLFTLLQNINPRNLLFLSG